MIKYAIVLEKIIYIFKQEITALITVQFLSGQEEKNAWREANSLRFHNGNLKCSQQIIAMKRYIGINIKFSHAYDWKATHAVSASNIIKFFPDVLLP